MHYGTLTVKYSIIHATIKCKTVYINHITSCIKIRLKFMLIQVFVCDLKNLSYPGAMNEH